MTEELVVCVGCGGNDFEQESLHPHDIVCTVCGLRYECHTLEVIPYEDI